MDWKGVETVVVKARGSFGVPQRSFKACHDVVHLHTDGGPFRRSSRRRRSPAQCCTQFPRVPLSLERRAEAADGGSALPLPRTSVYFRNQLKPPTVDRLGGGAAPIPGRRSCVFTVYGYGEKNKTKQTFCAYIFFSCWRCFFFCLRLLLTND